MIEPFNLSWIILTILQFTIPFILASRYKDKTRDEKLRFLFYLSSATAILWLIYKIGLSIDPEYPSFNFWNELPFHACNTTIILGILASRFDKKTIMAYCFFVGVPCAFLSLLMPDLDFVRLPILSIRAIGYYGTHALIIVMGLLFALFGLFKINYKSAAKSIGFFVVMSTLIHVVNIILRLTVFPDASYYYTFGFDENTILRALYRFIPVPLLYMVPIFFIALIIVWVETFIIRFVGKHSKRTQFDR